MENNEQQQASPTTKKSSRRVYETEQIRVYWDANICIASHKCVEGLPQVFQPKERPWIKIGAASADEIAEVVARCPSGALHYERLDGGQQEEVPEEVTVAPQPDGPLYVHGRLRILNPDGTLLREDSRMALCRCGESHRKPFCDGTHRSNGFKAE